jgi:hypothetical protein
MRDDQDLDGAEVVERYAARGGPSRPRDAWQLTADTANELRRLVLLELTDDAILSRLRPVLSAIRADLDEPAEPAQDHSAINQEAFISPKDERCRPPKNLR